MDITIKLLENLDTDNLESLDTLVYTSSLFIIPINIAALNHKFILMNLYIFLALTSWAHHACRHMKVPKNCIYDEIDKFACLAVITFGFMYTLFYTTFRKFFITVLGILCVVVCYYRSCKNREGGWKNRGIKNWKYHRPHIAMHIAGALTGIYVALN